MKKSLAVMLALIMVLCMIPTTALAKLDTGHKIDVRFTVLYVGDEFNIGYNYGTSEKTQFVCQYSTNHSDTAYNNHTIAISDIKAAADRATVNSGYQIVGWSKESNANPTVWPLNKSGTTACNKGTTIYLVAKNPNPQPNQPTDAEIKGLVGSGNIKVKCTTANTTHPIESYGLLDGSYTTGTVTKNGDAYTCTIAVDPAKYVTKYNGTNGDHTLNPDGQSGSITFEWKNNSWALAAGQNLPITFTVVHNTQELPKPDKPDPRPSATPTIDGLTGVEVVEVKCITKNSGHAEKSYQLIADSYEVGDVKGDAASGYTCDITVEPEKYVKAYNTEYSGHTLETEGQIGTIKLVWDNQKWKLATPSGVPVVFDVKCKNTQPENPAELTYFTKSRVRAITDNMPTPPEGVTFNTASPVTFDANHTTANLLYSFTVTGTPGAEVTITDTGAKFYNGTDWNTADKITVTLPAESITDYATYTVYGYRQFTKDNIINGALTNTATAGVEGSEKLVPGEATVPAEDKTGPAPSENPEPSPSTNPNPTPTPTPGGGNGGGHSHYYPTTTPVPVIVIPPKTGDMTIWQSILHFLGIR